MQADSLGVVAPVVEVTPTQAVSSVLQGQIDAFAFGIELILDGLEKTLARTR
jgi:ABC-type nitrate/sulfonate/bicarbonate transport system substrate-binding protein